MYFKFCFFFNSGLIDIACKQMANMVRGKSTVEKCKILGIPCDIGKKELNRYEKEQSSFLRRMRRLKLVDEKTGDWVEVCIIWVLIVIMRKGASGYLIARRAFLYKRDNKSH